MGVFPNSLSSLFNYNSIVTIGYLPGLGLLSSFHFMSDCFNICEDCYNKLVVPLSLRSLVLKDKLHKTKLIPISSL